MIAAGIVLTGGTSMMEGVVELAEEIFHVPVRLAKPNGVEGLTDVVANPIYATSVGLLIYGAKHHLGELVFARKEDDPIGFVARVKNWIKGNF